VVGQWKRDWSRRRLCRHNVRSPAPDLNRSSNVFECLYSVIVKIGVETVVAYVLVRTARYANASGFRDLLQASGDIASVTKEVVTFSDFVTLVDDNAKGDARLGPARAVKRSYREGLTCAARWRQPPGGAGVGVTRGSACADAGAALARCNAAEALTASANR
jgi:hypothetical protein